MSGSAPDKVRVARANTTMNEVSWSISKRYGLLVIIGFVAGFAYLLRGLFGPLLIGGLLAYILHPTVNLLKRRLKLPHRLAVSIVFLFFLILSGAIPILLAPFLADQFAIIRGEIALLQQRLNESSQQELSLVFIRIPLADLLAPIRLDNTNLFQSDNLFRVLRTGTTNFAWILVSIVTTYYLLLDWAKLREWLIGLAPPDHQSDLRKLYRQVARVWQAYLQGQLLLMAIVAVSTSIVSFAVGLPGALVIGLLAGLLDALPSVGPFIAIFIAAVVAWLEGSLFLPVSNELFALIVLVVLQGVQFLEHIYFRPRVMEHALRLHPAIVIVGIVSSLALAGVLVTLIIIPLIGSVMVVSRYVYDRVIPQNA